MDKRMTDERLAAMSGDCVKCRQYRKRIEELEAENKELDAALEASEHIRNGYDEDNRELQRKYESAQDLADKAETGYDTLMVKHIELERKHDELVDGLEDLPFKFADNGKPVVYMRDVNALLEKVKEKGDG